MTVKDHFEIVHHPNGGYAVVGQPDSEPTEIAKPRDRRFTSPYEALMYAGDLSAHRAPRYGAEVLPEVRQRTFPGKIKTRGA